ncbi:MAG: aminoglycoside 6-adenylyltransferase [Tissierellia bacterium]|nr:aminoglycoside 6-adenylyltransferase [Tissierellia bacterium]
MRDNNTIMGLILEIAKNDNRIRAVFQTGSRVNPSVGRDLMQDYDIIYCVRDVEEFIEDESFLEIMGETILIHKRESMKTLGNVFNEEFNYSCLFIDGVKIDFKFYPVEKISTLITTETLLMLLMDKDNLITQLPASSDVSYRVARPTKNEFEEATQEFFYRLVETMPYLYRRQIIGAYHAYQPVLKILNLMLGWFIADEKDYKVNLGKNFREVIKNLDEDYESIYFDIYPSMDSEDFWKSIFAVSALYRKLGLILSGRLDYIYPKELDVKVTAYTRKIWQMAKKARIQ